MPFDPVSDPTSLGQHCKIWKCRFDTYLVAIDVKENKQKRALLLYQVGQEAQEIFKTLMDIGDNYATAIAKLDQYFLTLTTKFSSSDKPHKNQKKQLNSSSLTYANYLSIVSLRILTRT